MGVVAAALAAAVVVESTKVVGGKVIHSLGRLLFLFFFKLLTHHVHMNYDDFGHWWNNIDVCGCVLRPRASIINIPQWQQGGSPGTTQTGKGNSSS